MEKETHIKNFSPYIQVHSETLRCFHSKLFKKKINFFI